MNHHLFICVNSNDIQQNAPGADASSVSYALPNVDENAPDLYIPSMSLITYCLMCAFCYGAAGDFSPEVLPDIISKCFITQIAEVLLIRLGFYLMQASVPLLDLFAYTGYKYLGLSINMSLGMIAGTLGYGTKGFYLAFLWTASAAAYFMLKTMAHNIPTVVSNTGPKREFMVIGFAVSQAASMWFVSQTKFL
jgi:protein transport protein YIF1